MVLILSPGLLNRNHLLLPQQPSRLQDPLQWEGHVKTWDQKDVMMEGQPGGGGSSQGPTPNPHSEACDRDKAVGPDSRQSLHPP